MREKKKMEETKMGEREAGESKLEIRTQSGRKRKKKGQTEKRERLMKGTGECTEPDVQGRYFLYLTTTVVSTELTPHHSSSKSSLATVYSYLTAAYLWIFKDLTHIGIDNHSSPSWRNNYSLGVLSLVHIWALRKGFPCSYIKRLQVY